ncbi:protoporphyrinogen oxidase [Synchytrium microbalum]|uniref:Protoporphyrinogen oxidase n=1 Tax=Synchytrium microbalum TaxID=1806994 RepID=A0A507C3X9_9FUNG|nr:protoporphyrinogen oxidase [Synchytrium microbalum]TPX32223.1 protoporphyrinogen oxidase [Synchytrium microbalum]
MSNIVVLGGGISGLAATYYLSSLLPATTITLVEQSSRWGGWIESIKRPNPQTNTQILFERGPRTLRPSGLPGAITLDLVHKIGLERNILKVPKTSPAARNRFLYYKSQINALPHSLSSLITSNAPATKGIIASGISEPFRRKAHVHDETIHSFISRRFGNHVADTLISSVVQGIWAGDAKNLSVKSTFTSLWDAERKFGSVVLGMLLNKPPKVDLRELCGGDEDEMRFITDVQETCSVYSFKDGMQEIPDALVGVLSKRKNVEMKLGVGCQELRVKGDSIEVKLSDSTHKSASHIISSIPIPSLSRILPQSIPKTDLSAIPYVDVCVINLAYASPNILPIDGFGYLIPPSENESILGVVFDSCALPQQDQVPMTRVTVMMGGHAFKAKFGEVDDVSNERLLQVALEALSRHLGIKEEPIDVVVGVQRQCIPQYVLGHADRMGNIRKALDEWSGNRISFIGAADGGVGLNDCIKSARDTVMTKFKQ